MSRNGSTWGKPSGRYFRFLSRVGREALGRAPSLTVVGCADGKFVLPAARRGWDVAAIDVDSRMIDGCPPEPALGVPEPVAGLRERLRREGLDQRVTVVLGDFMTADFPRRSDALWTSGSLQYSNNANHTIEALTDRLRDLVTRTGLVYIEYMLPVEPRLKGRPNCPPEHWWRHAFPRRGWHVLSHTVRHKQPDGPHPYAPFPHAHSWGRLLARRSD